MAIYFVNNFIVSIYGLREDWAANQPLCKVRAYFTILSCCAICYSYAIHAVGRLLLTVFHNHRYLNTHHLHWFMITFNWFFTIPLAGIPLFFDGAFVYEKESRLCTLTSKYFLMSVFIITVGFVLPLCVSITVYGIIICYARSSTLAIRLISNNTHSQLLNIKREMKVALNMIIILGVFGGGGTPYLILVLWQGINPHNEPPESFYLLAINAISFFVALMAFILLVSNKEIKNIILQYIFNKRSRVSPDANKQNLTALRTRF